MGQKVGAVEAIDAPDDGRMRRRAQETFLRDKKVDRMSELYETVLGQAPEPRQPWAGCGDEY